MAQRLATWRDRELPGRCPHRAKRPWSSQALTLGSSSPVSVLNGATLASASRIVVPLSAGISIDGSSHLVGTLDLNQGALAAVADASFDPVTLSNTITLNEDPSIHVAAGEILTLNGTVTEASGEFNAALELFGPGTIIFNNPANKITDGIGLLGTVEQGANGALGSGLISFTGGLIYDAGVTPSNPIYEYFDGGSGARSIILRGLAYTSGATATEGMSGLTITSGSDSITIAEQFPQIGHSYTVSAVPGGGTMVVNCYAAGTRIPRRIRKHLRSRSAVGAERPPAGDCLVTAFGIGRPVPR